MRPSGLMAALVLAVCGAASVFGQFREEEPGGARLGEARAQRWRCGLIVDAVGGPCRGIVGYVPFPDDWPEQHVKIIQTDVSPEVKVNYDVVDGTVKLMVVRINYLPAGQQAQALVTFEIRRRAILPPENTAVYRLPDPKKLDRKVLPYLAPSPKIESRDPKIKALPKQIGSEGQQAWQRVEAIYDWVRTNVEYKNGPLKGALAALKDGTGDCEELTSLFIAICRAADIPARTVWVPGHCYPEFYLLDERGRGHWFPCQAAGDRSFGAMPELRPILQKGDNFHPPWNRRIQQRYMAEYLTGTPAPGGGQPRVKFVREMSGGEAKD